MGTNKKKGRKPQKEGMQHIWQNNGKQRGRSSCTQSETRQEQPQPQDEDGQRHIHLNWSNFKSEFSGKQEEDAEAHLLHSNDWMDAYCFNEDIKVQRFCLILLGEARLWYHSLEPQGETTWAQLQNLFRQRYSKLGNTCEQLFHAWQSFMFDENAETLDSYVIRIRQVANLLGYGEPQILEVFKNTLPTKLYWILFPIEDLRQAIDTAKRILTKEKLDKQLTGLTSTSPFMSVREGTDRRVSFNTRDELGGKIDKLTVVMSKLAVKDSHERKPFKPQIYRTRGQNRSYGQGGYQARSDNGNRGYSMNNNARQNYRGNIFRGSFRGYGRQNSRENYRNERYGNNNRDRNRSRERALTRSYERDRSSINDRSRSGTRASTNSDRIRCYAFREYDHFARDCPNSREERDLEQLQHMLNMKEQDHRSLSISSLDEDYRSPLNL